MDEVQVIKCEFQTIKWFSFGRKYSLTIKNQKFVSDKEYQFDVSACRDTNEVLGIWIRDCDMPSIPLNFPWNKFPNVIVVEIRESKLKTITKDDFEGLAKKNLKVIYLTSNKIEYLPGDLLEDMNKLEKAVFANNKIKYIGTELISSLIKLKFLDFEGNININKKYDEESGSAAMQEIINTIFNNCQMPDEVHEKINLMLANRKLAHENLQLKAKNEELIQWKESAAAEMKNALKNENFKDFTITVNDRKFKVHKFLLVARSPVLAEMIQNNPDASILNLKDIPTDAFERVLDFLYNDTLPQDGTSMKDIFIASGRLKIEKLKNFAGDKLVNQVNEENACEMFALSKKYFHKGLRIRAFEVENKILEGDDPEMTADDPENTQKRIELKRKREIASKTFDKVACFKKLAN